MAPVRQIPASFAFRRLADLEAERKEIIVRVQMRRAAVKNPNEIADRAELAKLDGIIRSERIWLGLDEAEIVEICWNKMIFGFLVLNLSVWFAVGVIGLICGGFE